MEVITSSASSIMIVQIALSIFALGALTAVVRQVRAKHMRARTGVAWLLLWIGVLVVSWWPDVTSVVAFYVGVGRGADLVVYASLALIFYILLRIVMRLEDMQHILTRLIRERALNEWEQSSLRTYEKGTKDTKE